MGGACARHADDRGGGLMRSALYVGEVSHRRTAPLCHAFRYRVFSLLLDLGELDLLARRLRLLGINRAGLVSFHERDHGDRSGRPLRQQVDDMLARHGLAAARVELLCFPRLFGYVFNPLSIYFCFDAGDRPVALIHWVRNTFGEHHAYVLPVHDGGGAVLGQECDKVFHVSPFITPRGRYSFRILPPGQRLAIKITVEGGTDSMIAVQTGRRESLSDGHLAKRLMTHPLMTFKVILAIHWQALRLVLKGAPFYRRQPAAGDRG